MLVSCSWCHEINDLGQFTYCATCGHRADRPRVDCDCEVCEADLHWRSSDEFDRQMGSWFF
jgi:hypothetical protein